MNNAEPSTTGQELARVSPETLLLFDRADDEQIVMRIHGAALKECVYTFKQAGQDIYGLSVDGIEECKRELAKTGEVIRVDDVKIEYQDAETAYFKAYTSRWSVGMKTAPGQLDAQPHVFEMKLDTSVDGKRQPKYITTRNNVQLPDEFWFEKGMSKAVRNAEANLIPEYIKARIIERFKSAAKSVAPTPAQVDARVNEIHRGMEEKDERDKLIAGIVAAFEAKRWFQSDVKKFLRDNALSETLASRTADWSSIPTDILRDVKAKAEK